MLTARWPREAHTEVLQDTGLETHFKTSAGVRPQSHRAQLSPWTSVMTVAVVETQRDPPPRGFPDSPLDPAPTESPFEVTTSGQLGGGIREQLETVSGFYCG